MWDAGVLDRCAAAGRRVMAEHDVIRWRGTLRMLGGAPERVVAAEPLPGGLSGGELARLTLAAHTPGGGRSDASRRLKRVRPGPGRAVAAPGWEAFFRLAPAADAATLRAALADPTPYVAAVAALPWTLVHGDVWGPNLGFLPATHAAPRVGPHVLLLDWALATAGPATYDPLWLCGNWHALDPVRVLAVYRARLTRHLAARGSVLALATWPVLADAGYLRTALTCGEAPARTAAESAPRPSRRRAGARGRWWARRAALAARRLNP